MKRIVGFLPVLMILLLCACQPTPEREAVVNKGDRALETKIAVKTTEKKEYEVPARWEESMEIGSLCLIFQADVLYPEGEAHPVYTVKNHTFTAEEVCTYIYGMAQGKAELRLNTLSKEEIVFDMEMVKRGQYGDVDEETGEITWVPYEDEEEQMTQLAQELQQAPQEDTYVQLSPNLLQMDGSRNVIRDESGTLFYVSVLPERYLRISTSRKGDLQTERVVLMGGYAGEKPHALTNVLLAKESAEKIGEQVLSEMGLLEEYSIAHWEKARILEYVPEGFEVSSLGYCMGIGRKMGGTQSTHLYGWAYDSALKLDEEVYNKRWWQDILELYVTEEGAAYFGWDYPHEIVKTSTEDVELLPFSEIQQNIRQTFKNGYSWLEDYITPFSMITVKEIKLTCAIVPMADSQEEAFLCPVWAVIYNTDAREEQGNPAYVMLINAVDGSVCASR